MRSNDYPTSQQFPCAVVSSLSFAMLSALLAQYVASAVQKSAKLFHRPVPRRRATDLAIPSAVMAGDGSAGRTSAAGHAAGPETSTASADGPAFRSSRVAKLRTSPGEGASGMVRRRFFMLKQP